MAQVKQFEMKKKLFIASYYRQLSADIEMKNYKNKLILNL